MASNHAARVVLGEVEHLVISVLTVLSQTLAPDVDITLLLIDVVDTFGGGGRGAAPSADLSVDESIDGVTRDTIELSSNMAVGMEGVILGEIALVSSDKGSKSGNNEFHDDVFLLINQLYFE